MTIFMDRKPPSFVMLNRAPKDARVEARRRAPLNWTSESPDE